MNTCYELGCPFADPQTGTCLDTSCVAHPENTKKLVKIPIEKKAEENG